MMFYMDNIYKRRLGAFIKQKRITKKLFQTYLAKNLGHGTPQFISNGERGLAGSPREASPRLCQLLEINPHKTITLILNEDRRVLRKTIRRSRT